MNTTNKLSMEFAENVCVQNTYHGHLLEANKGSNPNIYKHRVALEPNFRKYNASNMFFASRKRPSLINRALKHKNKVQLARIFFPLKDKMYWHHYEEAICSLSGLSDFVSFEIVGNENGTKFFIGSLNKDIIGTIVGCWRSFLPDISYEYSNDPVAEISNSKDLFFMDIYNPPPLHWKTTECYDLTSSPLIKLASLFAQIKSPGLGFYQFIFQPVANDWAGNMKQLLEGESILGKRSPYGRSTREQIKPFTSKPLFAAKLRLGGNCTEPWFQSALKLFVSNFKCCGKDLQIHSYDDFRKVLTQKQISLSLVERSTYTSGMILASSEICSFVHLPDRSICDHTNIVCDYVNGFPIPVVLSSEGLPLGTATYQGKLSTIHIPSTSGNKNLYMIGSSTFGKSTAMIRQMLYRISQGYGIALIDFHGETAQELMDQIQDSDINRCINIDLSYRDHVLCMNPCDVANENDWGKLTGDYLESLKGLFAGGHGYRMLHILGKIIYGFMAIKRNFADIPVLLSGTSESEKICAEIINKVKNQEVKRFFQYEFGTYNQSVFSPIINKFSNLFLDERILRLFSVTTNKIDPRKTMDQSMIVIADLSVGKIAPEVASFFGVMLIAQFQKAAFSRTNIPQKQRRPYFLFIDEFHRLSSFAVIESILSECRKYQLFLGGLCHQTTGQIPDETLLALRSAANIMTFNINIDDAKRMTKLFDDKVSASDIIGLGVGEVYARISNHVVNFKTFPPLENVQGNAEKIIKSSKEKYYIPVNEIQKNMVKKRSRKYELF